MTTRKRPELKPLFIDRMQKILPEKEDYENYLKILKSEPVKSIRCNTLKISPEKLKARLEKKNWKIKQPFPEHPEIFIIESQLEPGELGRSLEHQLGYYYVQEIASMLPILALQPEKNQLILDLCASPGSKTTQLAAKMQNTGTIIANEVSFGRMKILSTNLERCGVTNTIITRQDGVALCKKLKKEGMRFDKILVDAPCSGEGTLRSSLKTYVMWNIKTVKNLPKIQKNLLASAIEILKPQGEIIYSTCTHAPEENESVVNEILEKFPEIKIEKVNLPIKCRPGMKEWENEKFLQEINSACRIYPHDANTEGFFIAKLKNGN